MELVAARQSFRERQTGVKGNAFYMTSRIHSQVAKWRLDFYLTGDIQKCFQKEKKAIMIQPLSHNFVAKSKTMKNLIDQTFLTAEAKTYKSLFSKFFNIIHIFLYKLQKTDSCHSLVRQ